MNEPAPAGSRKSGEFDHALVLSHRITDLLRPGIETLGDDTIVVDGILDANGHMEYSLEQFPKLCVIGLDRGDDALRRAEKRLTRFGNRLITLYVRFDSFTEVLSGKVPAAAGGNDAENILTRAAGKGITGVFFNLGISSMQLDQISRGSAYRIDAPLNIRMDASQGITAMDVFSTYLHGDITRVLPTYGDEYFIGRIAPVILHEQGKEPLTNSGRLIELLYGTIPATSRYKGGHPARRTFQTLHIEMGHELEVLENVLPRVCDALAVDRRTVFISYQSLEGCIVKKNFMERVKSIAPPGLPMELPGHEPYFALVTRGAEKALANEIENNPRAVPVRVRCIKWVQAD